MKFDIQHFRFNHARTADMLRAMNWVKDACELCGEKITEIRMGLQFDADICLIFWMGINLVKIGRQFNSVKNVQLK